MRIYIHIPFCEKKCKYCRFALTVAKKMKMKIYLEYLLKEIRDYSLKKEEIQSIYFGGGTPTSYSSDELSLILSEIRSNFKVSKSCEINLESTPTNVNANVLLEWKSLGITRISMGVQSLNNQTLLEVTREGNEDIFKALDALEGNFDNVGCDFIIGLPYMKPGETSENIECLLKKYSCIKHISPYMLEDYYYPGSWKENSIPESEYSKEYELVAKILEKYSFEKYELSNFSKPGYESKHNLGYWNHEEYIGFGLDASSFIGGKRFGNLDIFKEYYKGIKKYEEVLDEEDLRQEQIIFKLRGKGLNEEILTKNEVKNCENLIKNGLLIKKNGLYKVPLNQISLIDHILSQI